VKSDPKRWDDQYRKKAPFPGAGANAFLKRNIHLLPRGRALDLAAGEGKNAVFLARHGFTVEAIDISKVGLREAKKLARECGVKIQTRAADLDRYPIDRERYDLITDFFFLSRRLIPRLKKGLKKGGRIVFETYLTEQRTLGEGPKNPAYLLKPNELLRLFRDFRVLLYREGIFREGKSRKAVASLIAEKI
jgi:tellurite methyltransferase